jgi:folylpolyglutamate synthase/dihydropteroate synthase
LRGSPPTRRTITDNGRLCSNKGQGVAQRNEWSAKVMAVLRSGNTAAAIAQIKVAPSVKDLQALQSALAAAQWTGRWRAVDQAITENLALLSAPRLHRSP